MVLVRQRLGLMPALHPIATAPTPPEEAVRERPAQRPPRDPGLPQPRPVRGSARAQEPRRLHYLRKTALPQAPPALRLRWAGLPPARGIREPQSCCTIRARELGHSSTTATCNLTTLYSQAVSKSSVPRSSDDMGRTCDITERLPGNLSPAPGPSVSRMEQPITHGAFRLTG